jgi:hypothetical protein
VLLRDRVCLSDICINTLHKGDSDDDDNNNKFEIQQLGVEIRRMWDLKCTAVPVITGATGIVTESLRKI